MRCCVSKCMQIAGKPETTNVIAKSKFIFVNSLLGDLQNSTQAPGQWWHKWRHRCCRIQPCLNINKPANFSLYIDIHAGTVYHTSGISRMYDKRAFTALFTCLLSKHRGSACGLCPDGNVTREDFLAAFCFFRLKCSSTVEQVIEKDSNSLLRW